MILFLESLQDPASRGIASELRAGPGARATGRVFEGRPVVDFGGALLASTEELHLNAEGIDARLRAAGVSFTEIVFLSKHRSDSGRPTLTAHPLGNFGSAEFGGAAGRLTPAPGPLLTQALRSLRDARDRHAYAAEVSFEATHHGPRLETPAIFLELGSSEPQWQDPQGHRVIAEAARALLAPAPSWPIVVGLGGGHYAPRFTEAALTKQIHFAHLLPSHHAATADPAVLAPRIREASPGAAGVYYHDGTLKAPVRDAWLAAFDGLGLPRLRSRDWPAYAAPPGFRRFHQ